MKKISETETVIKKIIPYLKRRGYDIEKDLTFEASVNLDTKLRKGFIDILVTCGRKIPLFVIEVKRDGTKISSKHKKKALEYGKGKKCLFIAITNGQQFEVLNTTTSKPLKIDDSAFNRIPNKTELFKSVLPQLKKNPKCETITIPVDKEHPKALPYRPSLSLSKLNHLYKQCHNSIRKIEKNEEYAFSDFSKILFLKLLEEKWDFEQKKPPYTYTFHELTSMPTDQVPVAIKHMIKIIKEETEFGDVLDDPIRLKKDATYKTIVKKLSMVSFIDCDLDIKGAAFEYFVRATLKGKKLGQYFTPRPLVKLMVHLGGYEQIVNNLMHGMPFKQIDPACGTGGFLVYAMNLCIQDVEERLKKNEIHSSLATELIKKLKEDTFYGVDAHEGIACSAKMNMIIAGDGHNNIRCADSLKEEKLILDYNNSENETCNQGHLLLTNPPFGTSESESLSYDDLQPYDIKSTKGQSLFVQKMINSVYSGSKILTVIDNGVLNTASDTELRTHIFKTCRVEFVISLPEETFKPNKINVKSSVIVLTKREERDEDLLDDYPIGFIKIDSLGYDGAGNTTRGFMLERLIEEIRTLKVENLPINTVRHGYNWCGFKVNSSKIIKDSTKRLDVKYWDTITINKINEMKKKKEWHSVKQINVVETKRGKSPLATEYVSEEEGYALVVKAGTNISKNGELLTKGDYIEEGYFKEKYDRNIILQEGDVLLASTGDGTLGKCCVYRNTNNKQKTKPAIPDGHVTLIRVNQKEICPEFLCDYFRKGFGAEQIIRLYTGSTGLVEITPGEVDNIIIPPIPTKVEQEKISNNLRKMEKKTMKIIQNAHNKLSDAEKQFYESTLFFDF